jgi:hypothetical protein
MVSNSSPDAQQMSKVSIRRVGEAITALSVVLGLVFVGVEIRANTASSQAQSRQEIAAQNIDFLMRIVENESLAELWAQEWTPEFTDGLTRTERSRLFQTVIALMIRLENVYAQFDRGLIEESSLANYGMVQETFEKQGFWIMWRDVRYSFDPEFIDYFESVNSPMN